MVVEAGPNNQIVKKVAEIYKWLDAQIHGRSDLAGRCDACGKCCDFDAFDHHLFITPPELVFLAENPGAEGVKPMPGSRCPYNVNGKCTIYKYRFASCRIFCCNGDVDFQSGLSESVLKKLKTICTEFGIPYYYVDLASALNSFVAR